MLCVCVCVRACVCLQVGPIEAALPVGIDIMSRPFGEPVMLRIASAFEAATHHRRPPAGFGPLPRPAAQPSAPSATMG